MKKQSSLVIGRKPVLEELKMGRQPERIFIQKNLGGDVIGEIRKLAAVLQVPVNTVPIEKLNSLTRANHQGVVAIGSLVSYIDQQQMIDHIVSQGMVPFFVMLDGITDVRNIGAIARTAKCCGAQGLIIPDKGVGALNEEAMKSSAGALLQMQVCRVNSLLKAVDTFHLNGIKVFASDMQAKRKVYELDYTDPCCIIMGSEDKGIQPYLLKSSDERFVIPMAGGFDSFNVSVAAGIILYEAFRQRQ